MSWRGKWVGMIVGVAFGACGDDGASTPMDTATPGDTQGSDAADTSVDDTGVADTSVDDTGVVDTSEPDTHTADTAEPDTHTADTSEPDTHTADTAEPDTHTADTAEPDTSADRCACEGGATCLLARDEVACAALGPTCTSPMTLVEGCDLAEVMASCERTNTIHYQYWARIDGWLEDAAAGCDGTFTVAAIPAGQGAVCSCRRTAASCVQTYGAACDTLACDTAEGKQATTCSDAGTLPGRCVTRDGQRELVFYSAAVTAAQAEMACHGASASEYYWFPADL